MNAPGEQEDAMSERNELADERRDAFHTSDSQDT
jgi:hypothetical protein